MVGQTISSNLDGKHTSQRLQVSLPTPDRIPKIDVSSAVWKPLKEAFLSNSSINFTNAEIVNYFVLRRAVDGMPASDIKGMNNSALNLFKCGHFQDIVVCHLPEDHVCIRANCVPEIKKDRIYKFTLFMDKSSFDVVGADSGCPAKKGPHGSCKHIGGLCYALEEFTRIGKCPEYITCTDNLQERNKPRTKRYEFFLLLT